MYIVVCPNSWANDIESSIPARNCLAVNISINRFRGSGASLGRYLPWILLEELAQYDLDAKDPASGGVESLPDIFDVNKCVGLGAERSSMNAHSYVIHAASKSTVPVDSHEERLIEL